MGALHPVTAPRRIPLAELAARRLAVVAAHPDDETIGAGALLARRGFVDALIHVTDGAPRDMRDAAAHGFATREDYADARRGELDAALAAGGIAARRRVALGAADQEASLQLAPLARRLAGLLAEIRPQLVLTHAYEGGHPDHDAAAFVVHAACGLLGDAAPLIGEMASYHAAGGVFVAGEFLPDAEVEPTVLALDERECALKHRLFECFATQRAVLAAFPVGVERFRPAPPCRFDRPPHAGAPYYEGFSWGMTGARWRELAASALVELGLATS
jgi:LmbE family N-acetylglucosaminyl deacetylase